MDYLPNDTLIIKVKKDTKVVFHKFLKMNRDKKLTEELLDTFVEQLKKEIL